MKKSAPNSSAFQEMWSSYKVETLETIVLVIRSEHKDIALPRWRENWFKVDDGVNDGDTIHSSWEDIFEDWRQAEEAFLKGKALGLPFLPYEEILDDEGVYKVIELECLFLIKLIQNYSCQKHGKIFELIELHIQIVLSTVDQIHGREILKREQKKARAGSGVGQKRAKAKRIEELVETLQQYVKPGSDHVLISLREFYDMIDATFKGLEGYPRHYLTIKKYREEAERILGKKIVHPTTEKSA